MNVITPADIEANITSEHYFTAAQGAAGVVSGEMVNRFLTWPVPADVYPDGKPGEPGRTGTNLLTAPQALDMLANVVVAPEAPHPLACLTFCVLVLRNGFTIVGTNHGPADPANFDADMGRKYAREHAIQQIWPLMGYELKQRLHEEQAKILGRFKGPFDGCPTHDFQSNAKYGGDVCTQCGAPRGTKKAREECKHQVAK